MRGLTFVLVLVLCAVNAFAQPGDPPDPTEIPFGMVEYLLIAGGALGLRKIVLERNKTKK